MLLIVGLGNPGSKYAMTRHNIGFMAVDSIAHDHGFSRWSSKFKAEIAEGEIAGEKIILMKPQTFMNLSGESVGEAMHFYRLQPAQILVIHDELDLPPGKIRIKTGGGAGGHNGLKSIDGRCTKEYRRLRLGIGHPGDKDRVASYVLEAFEKDERTWLEPLLDAITSHISLLVKGEESQFMNKLAPLTGQKPEEEKPEAKAKSEKAGSEKPKPQGQSHIRQARSNSPKEITATGPMAEMLKKLLGK
jgi:peptidyl-tRNA hydrolase, PTH1 family